MKSKLDSSSKYRIRIFDLHPIITSIELIFMGVFLYILTHHVLTSAKIIEWFEQSIYQVIYVLVLSIAVIACIYILFQRHISYLVLHLDKNIVVESSWLKDKQQVKNYKIWWNYIYGRVFYDQITGYQSAKTNRISLWLEIELMDGERLLINQRLAPWKSTPENISYSDKMEEYSNNRNLPIIYLKTFNSLEKLHNNFLLLYAS